FDEEEYIQALKPDGLDGEEVDREHAVPVRSYERPPGRSSSCANRSETRLPKPRAYGRRRNGEAQAFHFADDAQIAPWRIVARTAGPSPEDRELLPEHDDFQLLEIARPKTPHRELKRPPKHHVTAREDHEASWSRDHRRILHKT